MEAGVTSRILHGDVLVAFAESVVVGDEDAMAAARQAVVDSLGVEAMVDAAGVASNFQRMVRIADSTGIPLGEGLERFSHEVRAELGLERFRAAKVAG